MLTSGATVLIQHILFPPSLSKQTLTIFGAGISAAPGVPKEKIKQTKKYQQYQNLKHCHNKKQTINILQPSSRWINVQGYFH